jgi:hypothetical protein
VSSTADKLLKLVMAEYDEQCFQDEIARQLVHDLMSNSLKGMSQHKIAAIAKRWFPEEF